MSENTVTSSLKAIREGAGVGVREMARRLGMSPSSYSHYEDPKRFKAPYLPMAWAIKFADALEPSGVDRARILALVGADKGEDVTTLDQRLSELSPRRQQMLLDLLSDLEAAEAAQREPRGSAPDDQG